MKFSLDTNAVIALNRQSPRITQRMYQHQPEDMRISTIVFHELYFGAFKSAQTAQNLQNIADLKFPMLDFTQDDARVAGEIRDTLRRAGTPIGPYDTLIAGQALARGLTLITRNIREFDRVPGLKVENWED